MAVIINGDTGIDKITDGSVVQADLASGVAGTGPAFSAYRSGDQSVTSGVYTKIAFNAETFDTASCFDSTTNYRFTPNIAGYYQLNCTVSHNGTSVSSAVPAVYKNGSIYQYGPYIQATNANSSISTMLYLNGTTDYVEIYAYQTGSVAAWSGNTYSTWFNGHLVRAA